MRLFSALFPDDAAREDLAAVLATLDGDFNPSDKWHVTLCFHGDGDDPVARAAWLRERAAGLGPVRLRLSSAGTFADVLWVGVEPADGALATTAAAVRGHVPGHVERHAYTPHLTIARSRHKSLDASPLLDYKGPWWTSSELVLVRSERTPSGHRYTPLDAVPLRGLR